MLRALLHRGCFWIAVAAFFASFPAFATPQIVRVDGSIFDTAGLPITTNKDIRISAYAAATGGSALWTSSVYNTPLSSGRFTINLDASSGSPSLSSRIGALAASASIWFEIEVDSGAANGSMDTSTIVRPRIRSRGSLFALSSSQADSLTGVTATATELNYLSGVTANVQSQLNSKGSASGFTLSAKSGNFTASDGAGYYYRISATATVTLPASPADGSVRKFKVTGGTATFNTTGGDVINRANGTTSASGTLTLESQDGVLELIAVTGGWDET
ncbi:MAG: hypothetical protein JST16_15700 [Bdellovibrionales bacterium]|nr:hypothetical protein [Bdellovibrionales bacterium]